MMSLRIDGATHRLRGSKGSGISDLMTTVVDGCYVSAWEPSPKELETLNAGGSVRLWCMGSQPPVALTVAEHVSQS